MIISHLWETKFITKCPPTDIDLFSNTWTLEVTANPDIYVDCFSSTDLSQLTSIISISKPPTCLLNPIPTRLFKESLPLVGPFLLDMINPLLFAGYVPQSFREAVIKPLLEKPALDPKVLAARQVSNLPFLSKILQKIVANQLCDFLHNNGCQLGFRAHHSTEIVLVKVTTDFLLASDKGLVSVLVLLDLSAVFDKTDHHIQLHRLRSLIGIKGTALSWFKSYLWDCFQFVHVNNKSSVRSKVSQGVPQGLVLGPILFTLYMLPLGTIIRDHSVNFHLYADGSHL